MPVIQSVINKPFDYNFYDKLEDCVNEMKQKEMSEEADNEGNWRPEDYFDGVAGDLMQVFETYFFDYDLFKILDIKYVDGQFILPDESLEDLAYSFEVDILVHIFKEKLSKKPGYEFINEEMLYLLYKGEHVLLNNDTPDDIKNSDDYFFYWVDMIVRTHHDEIYSDVDFIKNKYSNYVINLSRTSLYNDFKTNYSLNKKELELNKRPIDLIKFLPERAELLSRFDKAEHILIKNDIEDKNYNKNLYNANYFSQISNILDKIIKEEKIRKIKQNTGQILAENFNKDSLSKNHFYKHIKSITDKEIDKTYNVERKDENTIIFSDPFKDVISFYKNNINLIKSNQKLGKENKDYFDIYNTKSAEELFDGFHALKDKSELKKYMKKYIGSHSHLLNDESLKLFKIIKDNKVDRDLVKSELSSIVQFECSEVLNTHLNNIINKTNDFSKYQLLSKINKNELDVNIFYEKDNIIAVKLNNLESATILAPSSWCIGRSQSLFSQYKGKGHNIIVFNYNKEEVDGDSVIGVSITGNGKIKDTFNKFNSSILNKKNILNIDDIIQASKINDIEKDVQAYKDKTKNIYQTIDPISTMIKCGVNDITKENVKDLVIISLDNNKKFNSWEDKDWFENVLKLASILKKENKEIDVLSIKSVESIAKNINHPLVFLQEKEKEKEKEKISTKNKPKL